VGGIAQILRELKAWNRLDSNTEQKSRDKETGEFRSPRLAAFPFPASECRLLDAEATRIQYADAALAPEQARGRGCSRDC
jgi:hypothetical protein